MVINGNIVICRIFRKIKLCYPGGLFMGVVTLKEILKDAKEKGYGVGLFNTINLEMARAIIGAAEEQNSPVIIGLAEVHMPYGSLDTLAPIMVKAARDAKVPVAIHFDHGMSFEYIVKAMHLGFTSVMYDGSTLSYDENIQRTREIVKIANALGVSVEAELGHVGGGEDGKNDEYEEQYTNVNQALDFVQRTGIDALAIAIGTAHGEYKVKPKLDINRLSQIANKVDIPLVLHGGSGLSDEDFRNCIRNGISKVNIFTDMSTAAVKTIEQTLNSDINKISYPDLIQITMQGIREEVATKMILFGSNNRA